MRRSRVAVLVVVIAQGCATQTQPSLIQRYFHPPEMEGRPAWLQILYFMGPGH